MCVRLYAGIATLKYILSDQMVGRLSGGESGIRTHGTVSRTHAFQACALSHSAISPDALSWSVQAIFASRSGLNNGESSKLLVVFYNSQTGSAPQRSGRRPWICTAANQTSDRLGEDDLAIGRGLRLHRFAHVRPPPRN